VCDRFAPELHLVTGRRRFSQAISEGDGISVVALVDGPDAAQRAEAEGAEGVLVHGTHATELGRINEAISVPILFYWNGEEAERLHGADACVLDLAVWSSGGGPGDAVGRAHAELDDHFELALRVEDEEQLESALETFDPELLVLAGHDEQALEGVLDLLPDVPAGKLAIADVPTATREDIAELERAGVDAVIVRAADIAELVGESPPEV
jgi:NAD(P)H-dependent flavin oxidoreductase YrpB (nitropropane dioxygenase family)